MEGIDDGQGGYFLVTAFAFAPGRPPGEVGWTPARYERYGRLIGLMHALTKDYAPPAPSWRRPSWPAVFADELRGLLSGRDEIIHSRYQELTRHIERLPRDRDSYGLIHFDAHGGNLHVDGDTITLFDFDDCVYNWFIGDIAMVIFYMITNADDPSGVLADFLPHFLRGYRAENRLDPRHPVSYTHLDVYKRQATTRAFTRPWNSSSASRNVSPSLRKWAAKRPSYSAAARARAMSSVVSA